MIPDQVSEPPRRNSGVRQRDIASRDVAVALVATGALVALSDIHTHASAGRCAPGYKCD
jgi:hypothetical protein